MRDLPKRFTQKPSFFAGSVSTHPVEIKNLQARIKNLEATNYWHLSTLDLLSEMSEIHGDTAKQADPINIYKQVLDNISEALQPSSLGLMIADEISGEFEMKVCAPRGSYQPLIDESDKLIDSGDFAWTLNHHLPHLIKAKTGEHSVVLSAFATSSNMYGMLIATLTKQSKFTEALKKLVSIILFNGAHALENVLLYQKIENHRAKLSNQVEQRNNELAYHISHDTKTGLLNSDAILNHIKNTLSHPDVEQAAIGYIDIEGFSRINTAYSFQTGNKLLKLIADRLLELFNGDALNDVIANYDSSFSAIARVTGDEFVFFVAGKFDQKSLKPLLEKCLVTLLKPYSTAIIADELHLDFSLGACFITNKSLDPRDCIQHAEMAMYQAKDNGRNSISVYSSEMKDARGHSSLQIEKELKEAYLKEQFCLFYQPKVSLNTHKIIGAEALIRWNHPERGLVPPDDFIDAMEKTGLIKQVGIWVFRHACKQIKQWENTSQFSVPIAINLSPLQIDAELPATLQSIIKEEQVRTDQLELEITETSITRDIENAVGILSQLHDSGFKISIDDFGTGYSSLLLLKQFPIDKLKIDRSFIRDILSSPNDEAIVRAVIAMSQSLNLQVIAEGIEDEKQYQLLQSMGCHEVQGYFVSKPIPKDLFLPFAQNWQDRPKIISSKD